jgi:hypothetical protein
LQFRRYLWSYLLEQYDIGIPTPDLGQYKLGDIAVPQKIHIEEGERVTLRRRYGISP